MSTGETKTPNTSTGEIKPPDMSTVETKPPDMLEGETKPPDMSAGKTKPPNMSTGETMLPNQSTGETKPPDMSAGESKPPEMLAKETKPPNMSTGETKPPNMSTGETKPPDMLAGETKPPNMSTGETKLPNKSTGETKPPDMSAGESKPPNMPTGETKQLDMLAGETKPPRIKVGTDDFYDLIVNSDIFVDKSLMIKEFLEDRSSVVLITRLRRWGKSLNMKMLQKFLEIEVDETGKALPEERRVNGKLFMGGQIDLGDGRKKSLTKLQISQHSDIISEYQGRFPVIYLSFKDVNGSTYEEIKSGISNQVFKLFRKHPYFKNYTERNKLPVNVFRKFTKGDEYNIIKEKVNAYYYTDELNEEQLIHSLRRLSIGLEYHFRKKVYILIDDYEIPVHNAFGNFGNNSEEFQKVMDLLRGLIHSTFLTNNYKKKGLITGMYSLQKYLDRDGIQRTEVKEYTFDDENYAKFYGFTEADVDELLTKVPTATKPEQIKDWYKGSSFEGEVIYNPWLIMHCLANGKKIDHYWIDSDQAGLVEKTEVSITKYLDLCSGQKIISRIISQINFAEDKFSWKIFMTDLTSKESKEEICELFIQSKEVRNIRILKTILHYASNNLKLNKDVLWFYELLHSGKIIEFREELEKVCSDETDKYHKTSKPIKFKCFMLRAYIHALLHDYNMDSEEETRNYFKFLKIFMDCKFFGHVNDKFST